MTTQKSTREGKAFIGVSLDSQLFSRTWVRYALKFVFQKHHSLLFLLADDLLRYTRTAQVISGKAILKIPETSQLVNRKRIEVQRFLHSEVKRLDSNSQAQILIKSWNSFADSSYVQILRHLQIAYATIVPFQQCVNDVALDHINKTFAKFRFPNPLQTSVAFLLDEVAMCLKITEMDEFSFEYYPTQQIDILTQLYSDKFTFYGLSVESLTGKNKRSRRFQILDEESIDSHCEVKVKVTP